MHLPEIAHSSDTPLYNVIKPILEVECVGANCGRREKRREYANSYFCRSDAQGSDQRGQAASHPKVRPGEGLHRVRPLRKRLHAQFIQRSI